MPDTSGEQLSVISQQIDTMIQILGQRAQSTGEQMVKDVDSGDAREVSNKEGQPKVRKIVKEAEPVKILSYSPKALESLSKAVTTQGEKTTERVEKKTGGFIESLLSTIGTPLLALAGGITALLTATNIDFGAFEGLTNMIGKQGLVGGLKIFMKPFLKFAGKSGLKLLKRIPVIGSIVGLYFAHERYKNKDWVGMTIEIASSIANLVPGIGTFLSIGLDLLNAFLDYKSTTADGDLKGDKAGIIAEMAKPMMEWLEKNGRDIPFIGAFYHGKDMIQSFKDGKWSDGLFSLAQTAAALVPGVGMLLTPGLNFLRAMVDPKYRQKTNLGEAAAGAMDWLSGLWDTIKDWFGGILHGIADNLPIGSDFAHDWLEGKGFKNPNKAARTKQIEQSRATTRANWDSRELNRLRELKQQDRLNDRMSARLQELEGIDGARADGGPITSGGTYLVGERGPELIQTNQSGTVHSNESIVTLLQQNNEILTNLSTEIVTAVRDTGTTVNNSVASNTVNQSNSIPSAQSFRDRVRDNMFK